MKLVETSPLDRLQGIGDAVQLAILRRMRPDLAGLAVARRHQGNGYGRFLLADALFRAVKSEIASFAVIVDAKDESARTFYERESFLPFPDQPMKLFRPMADIAELFR